MVYVGDLEGTEMDLEEIFIFTKKNYHKYIIVLAKENYLNMF